MAVDIVTARVNGRAFTDWQSVSIDVSIETAARSFQLEATGLEVENIPIKQDDKIEILIDNELVLTGFVEATGGSDSATDRSFEIAGRSLTADIIDCSNIAKRTHKGISHSQLATRLCAPYGVKVVLDSNDPLLFEPIKRFTVEPDEEVFAALERAAKLRAILMFDDPQGRLVLQVGAKGRFPLQVEALIKHGDNKISARSQIDGSKMFSEYRIKGQRIGTDNDNGNAVAIVGSSAPGDGPRRLRVKTLISKSSLTPKQAKSRANWEAAQAFGRASTLTETVKGWRDQGGCLWTPGTIIEVDDPVRQWIGQFLVVAARYSKSTDGGTTTDVTVAPEGGYYAELPKSPRKGIKAWRALTS